MAFKTKPSAAPLTAVLVGGLMALASLPAFADDNPKQRVPSPEQGLALAEKLCASCHVTGTDAGAGGTKPVGPPPFVTIANRPEQTAERIKGILIAPHAPMPDLQLTNDEMTDLIAYLDTLRKIEPPLLPSGNRDKPKRPEPT